MIKKVTVKFCDNIRIRICGELAFFVNISNNNVFATSKKTLDCLLSYMQMEKQEKSNWKLDKLIKKMEEKNILEIIINES